MTIQKIRSGRVTSLVADQFVGEIGQIFYNEELGDLRLSDGITPGGVLLATGGGGGTPLLPATTTRLGGIKVGSGLLITLNGVLSIDPASIPSNYNLPTASTSVLGGVKVDGTSITITNGVISATPVTSISGNAATVTNGVYTTGNYANPSWITSLDYSKLTNVPASYVYTLPTASTSVLGGVKVDGSTITITNGVISATPVTSISGNAATVTNGVYTTGSYSNPSWITSLDYSKLTNVPAPYVYTLPTASTLVLGGVKVDGSTITIDSNGVISGANTYTLPTSSTTTLGGVKVDGSTITITNGVISATPTVNITGNAATVTNGVYTTGSYSNPSWITSLAYSKITGTPSAYTLPTATTSMLGGIKIGTGLLIDQTGVVSVNIPSVQSNPLTTKLSGTLLSSTTNSINFTGTGVSATVVGNDVTVEIAASSGGGLSYAINVDGGVPGSVYGGINPIDGGYI